MRRAQDERKKDLLPHRAPERRKGDGEHGELIPRSKQIRHEENHGRNPREHDGISDSESLEDERVLADGGEEGGILRAVATDDESTRASKGL